MSRLWQLHNIKPHLSRTFKLSRDAKFLEKLTGVLGLYLNPPQKAVVLCLDEKSKVQALDRTQPGLPLKNGRCCKVKNLGASSEAFGSMILQNQIEPNQASGYQTHSESRTTTNATVRPPLRRVEPVGWVKSLVNVTPGTATKSG